MAVAHLFFRPRRWHRDMHVLLELIFRDEGRFDLNNIHTYPFGAICQAFLLRQLQQEVISIAVLHV